MFGSRWTDGWKRRWRYSDNCASDWNWIDHKTSKGERWVYMNHAATIPATKLKARVVATTVSLAIGIMWLPSRMS
jgi:hypothetical protein